VNADSGNPSGDRGKSAGDFLRLLGNGRDFGLKTFELYVPDGEGALRKPLGSCGALLPDGRALCVILGDNIVENNICALSRISRIRTRRQDSFERSFGRERFAWRKYAEAHVIGIEEKPKAPTSNYAVIGDLSLRRDRIERFTSEALGPGQLEITDVNNFYSRRAT